MQRRPQPDLVAAKRFVAFGVADQELRRSQVPHHRYGGNYNHNYETMWTCSSDNLFLNWKQQYYIVHDRFHQRYWWLETLNSKYYPSSYCLSSLGVKTYGSLISVYRCNSSLNEAWWQG